MKEHLLQPLFVCFIALLTITTVHAQQGGPDAFGYTWISSDEPGGPAFQWVDITGIGTEVTGLGDDNSTGPISMGMDFHFYWSDYSDLKIGSNGWLSFDNVSNIASCFPVIPTVGGPNNLIAPLMSDLNFANNALGKMYTYHDQPNNRFIISYVNVSHWTQANPIFGSNTFQVILSNADSSITFQYLDMELDFAYTCTGSGKITAGIENLTGSIGLEVYSGVMPPSNTAIKFTRPAVPLIDVPDATPIANQNADNEGIFLVPDEMVTLTSTISSAGNADITSDIPVGATVRSFLTGGTIYSDIQNIEGGLIAGDETTINFSPITIDWSPGTYFFDVQTSSTDDLNPSNNTNTTEINVLDISQELVTLGYAIGVNQSGTISWAGGGNGDSGGGIEIEPPFYPATLVGFEVAVTATSADGFTIRVFDDDGANNSPGTEMTTESIPPGGYFPGNWSQYDLENSVTINDGSLYLGWYMDGNNVGLIVENEGPLSNRAYEILAGSWAKYRVEADLMLRAIFENPLFVSTKDIVEDSQLAVFPNPNNGSFQIDNTKGGQGIKNIRIFNTLGAVVFEQKQNILVGSQFSVTTDLNAGLYYLELKTEDDRRIVRKVMVD
ncbi:MAG: T9SS type A sorting domain-containing protein [Bacteroidota bacterium]